MWLLQAVRLGECFVSIAKIGDVKRMETKNGNEGMTAVGFSRKEW